MVIRQIIKDLRKEWSWAFFYTVVATMIAMAVFYISISFPMAQRESASIQSFIEQNVIMFRFQNAQMEPNKENSDSVNDGDQYSEDIMDYLQSSLSKVGKAGSFVFVMNDGYTDAKYEQILILFGQYGKLAELSYEEEMAVFVPKTCSDDVGKKLLISGQEIEVVDCIDAKFKLYHPLFYIDVGDSLLENTLILCTNDFKKAHQMFLGWGLSSEVFERMVLVDPSAEEMNQLQAQLYEKKGMLYTGISTEDFTKTTTTADIRTHRLLLWFYILAGILLIIMLVCNMIRLIETHVADYTVHHLYGAPIRIIQERVGGFVLALNMFPIIGIIFILSINKMVLWYILPICIVLVLCLCFFVALYAGRRVGTMNGLKNLRRDY